MSPPPITTTSFTPVDRLREIRVENMLVLVVSLEKVFTIQSWPAVQTTDYRLAAGCGVLGLVIVWLGAPATYSQYTVLSTL